MTKQEVLRELNDLLHENESHIAEIKESVDRSGLDAIILKSQAYRTAIRHVEKLDEPLTAEKTIFKIANPEIEVVNTKSPIRALGTVL